MLPGQVHTLHSRVDIDFQTSVDGDKAQMANMDVIAPDCGRRPKLETSIERHLSSAKTPAVG